jgi:hypothetical protein
MPETTKINFAPGVNREGTQYSAEGSWYDSDKVRFRKGMPESIGGWTKFTNNTFLGTCRSIFRWFDLDSDRLYGIGTSLKMYILQGNAFNDITPIRSTGTLGTNPFTTDASGSAVVTVTHSTHGATNNDFVTFASATGPIDGIPASEFNAEHQITYVDANTYKITLTTVATSGSVAGGGASCTFAYQIEAGLNTSVAGSGWGAGVWGRGTWGSSATVGVAGQLRIIHQANWGEDLLFNVRNGGGYRWDTSAGVGTRATALTAEAGASNVPTVMTQLFVSPEDRHVVAIGANTIGSAVQDNMFVRWSDQESLADWTPTVDNTSGSKRLGVGSHFIGGTHVTKGESVLWTDKGMYSMQYIGTPHTFGFKSIGGGDTIIGPNAHAYVNDTLFWMGPTNFHTYTGTIRNLPCSVLAYVFNDINTDEADQIFSATNDSFNEIAWHYCSADSTTIDRYVCYNWETKVWTIGTLARSAWWGEPDVEKPIAAGLDGYIYQHESGTDADGVALASHIESSDFDIGDGHQFSFVTKVIPDVEFRGIASDPTFDIVIKKRNAPNEDLTTAVTLAITGSTLEKRPRVRARQVVLRYEGSKVGSGWRLGSTRISIQPDGKR